jgi:protein gp37
VKKPSKIFVVSMGDLFGDWVSDEWIKAVGLASQAAPWHTYQFLTKNPERYAGWQFPSQAWIGATATDQPSYNRAAVALQRAHDVQERAVPTFVSVEPMLGPVGLDSFYSFPSWLIIGAQTGRRAEQPDPSWVRDLIAQADDLGIPVFTKNSLPDWDRKEFPRSA